VVVVIEGRNAGHSGEQESDSALVAAAQLGSVQAFDMLVARYYGPVLRYLERQIGDVDLAADLGQETFLDAYRSLDRLIGDRPFAAWLYQIARNNLRREWRARKLRRLISLDWLHERAPDKSPALWQADASRAVQERDLVQRALDELNPTLREVLVLHDLWGFTAKEIGELLQISPAAAGQRLNRASQQFRQRHEGLERL